MSMPAHPPEPSLPAPSEVEELRRQIAWKEAHPLDCLLVIEAGGRRCRCCQTCFHWQRLLDAEDRAAVLRSGLSAILGRAYSVPADVLAAIRALLYEASE